MVEDIQKVRNAVKFAKYPPVGKRSQGNGQYGALWGADYRKIANDNIMQSWKVVMLHYRNHGVTAGTDIPLVFPHLALLFGFTFMALAAMVRIRSYISGKFE